MAYCPGSGISPTILIQGIACTEYSNWRTRRLELGHMSKRSCDCRIPKTAISRQAPATVRAPGIAAPYFPVLEPERQGVGECNVGGDRGMSVGRAVLTARPGRRNAA